MDPVSKDFLGVWGQSAAMLQTWLQRALAQHRQAAPAPAYTSPPLLVNAFFENSTRTQTSFTLAAQRLGMHTMTLPVAQSAIRKGESLLDTVDTLGTLGAHVVVIRHRQAHLPHFIAERVRCAVINGGDGHNEHPTQALGDALTLWLHFGSLQGLQVVIAGDIAHSRVARSNTWLLTRLGAKVTLVGLHAPQLDTWAAYTGAKRLSAWQLDTALAYADVVMCLRLQREREALLQPQHYAKLFGLSAARLNHSPQHLQLMHPGPILWGCELHEDLRHSPRLLVNAQMHCGVVARSAVLQHVLEKAV